MNLDREMQNRFSYWFEKVKDCGIKTPKTVVFQVPTEIIEACGEDGSIENIEASMEKIRAWVKGVVLPELRKQGMGTLLFVKNSIFSNKFDAKTCLTRTDHIADAMKEINYAAMSMIFGYDGTDELVIRDRVFDNSTTTPKIYNGLPLRPEFRVFYDFDRHMVLYTANYWDYDTVYPHLFDATDKIIFDHERMRLEKFFQQYCEHVEEMVEIAMENVKGLTGPWSVDILYDDLGEYGNSEFWLIDMATAERSAYWDSETAEGIYALSDSKEEKGSE